MDSKLYSDFLVLVRLGIGTTDESTISNPVDWGAIKKLADQQGLSAVVLDGIEVLRKRSIYLTMPEKRFMTQWIGTVLKGYEHRYELYCRAIAEMAGFYREHGFKMMVLKGYACSLDWPKPEHRPCGDIDIWQFGRQKEADAVIMREKGIKVDDGHHHHSVFCWRGFMVENHYDFVNVLARRSSAEMEKVFKELGQDDANSVALLGEKVYLPNVNLHALFLIYHTMLHFTSTEMSVRQLLDWGMCAQKHEKEIDWDWLSRTMDKYNLKVFFEIINTILVDDLGFDKSILHGKYYNHTLKSRVLSDTLCPEFSGEEPKSRFKRLGFRYLRWKAHEWKRQLCFSDSHSSIFWRAVWGHLLKPKSV